MAVEAQIRELQQIVLEKDNLLQVLTERLELAAEQLDRLRRQGGALEPSQPSNAPAKVESPKVVDDLRQMATDWRDLQTRDWFGQLEQRLEGIHELVSNLKSGPVRSQPEEPKATSSVADILSKYGATSVATPEPEPAKVAPPAEVTDTVNCDEPAATLQLPEPPHPIDIESGSTEELREGLREREVYICRLRDYLLAYDALTDTPIEGIDLSSFAPEQREIAEAWEAKIRKELRQTQIQLWVERAQLSREQMQMQQMQHQLETETRRLGLASGKGAAGGSGTAAAGSDGQRSKNWMGLFGGK